MIITMTKVENPARVTFLHLEGKLDGANFEILIDQAQDIFSEGVRNLILDMSKLTYISSAGISALHQVSLLFRGDERFRKDGGWAAFHSIDRDRDKGSQEHVKLLSPTREVLEVLNMTGFDTLFEIYSDIDLAVDSFRSKVPVMRGF
jgi:anti-anti-sigma regulatory factor